MSAIGNILNSIKNKFNELLTESCNSQKSSSAQQNQYTSVFPQAGKQAVKKADMQGNTFDLIQQYQEQMNNTPIAGLKAPVFGKVNGKTLSNNNLLNVDYSSLQNGQYNITGYEVVSLDDGTKTLKPIAIELSESQQVSDFTNSEGLDRRIETIRISENLSKTVQQELIAIGKEKGFTVEVLQNVNDNYKQNGEWVEDYSNYRPDGKVMVSNEDIRYEQKKLLISQERRNARITYPTIPQGAVAEGKYSENYSKRIQEHDLVRGNTYLEGGNVLTTRKPDGTSSAIIGAESINASRIVMQNNYEKQHNGKIKEFSDKEVIAEIAKDLGISSENITFIPQYDFHIDMCYRPMKDGQIAVPDYQEAINILQTQKLEGISEKEQQILLNQLTRIETRTRGIREQAEQELVKNGYEIVKLPCFSTMKLKEGPQTNYMNAVLGTAPDNSTFYITNKSDYPALDNIIQDYLHNAGIDDVYFVSTTDYLRKEGGIDCLTKEPARKL